MQIKLIVVVVVIVINYCTIRCPKGVILKPNNQFLGPLIISCMVLV